MIEIEHDRWPPDGDRERRWGVVIPAVGGDVTLRNFAVDPVDGDYPPTVQLSWAEWLAAHDDYGLTVDGVPL